MRIEYADPVKLNSVVDRLVKLLPLRLLAPYSFAHDLGFPLAQVAELGNIRIETAKIRLTRAMLRLRTGLVSTDLSLDKRQAIIALDLVDELRSDLKRIDRGRAAVKPRLPQVARSSDTLTLPTENGHALKTPAPAPRPLSPHPDLELVTSYLLDECRPHTRDEIQSRLRSDATFCLFVAPILIAWSVKPRALRGDAHRLVGASDND